MIDDELEGLLEVTRFRSCSGPTSKRYLLDGRILLVLPGPPLPDLIQAHQILGDLADLEQILVSKNPKLLHLTERTLLYHVIDGLGVTFPIDGPKCMIQWRARIAYSDVAREIDRKSVV